jgi:hypothetical protein
VLRKYGRFLEPISQIVQGKFAASVDERKLEAAVRNVAEPQGRPAVCGAAGAKAVANPIP